MDTTIEWDSLSPFSPAISKDYHAYVAVVLMSIGNPDPLSFAAVNPPCLCPRANGLLRLPGLSLTGVFFLSRNPVLLRLLLPAVVLIAVRRQNRRRPGYRCPGIGSLCVNVTRLRSRTIAYERGRFGAVFLMCAAGVYV